MPTFTYLRTPRRAEIIILISLSPPSILPPGGGAEVRMGEPTIQNCNDPASMAMLLYSQDPGNFLAKLSDIMLLRLTAVDTDVLCLVTPTPHQDLPGGNTLDAHGSNTPSYDTQGFLGPDPNTANFSWIKSDLISIGI